MSGSRFSLCIRGAALAWSLGLAAGVCPARAALRVPGDFNELPNAIEAAAPGDTIQIVGNGGATFHDSGRVIDKDLVLQGGWRADFVVRDPNVYVTVVRDTTNEFRQPLFQLNGSVRVEFDGLQFIGGQQGIRAEEGADLVIRDCLFRSQRNITVADSTVINRAGGALRMVGGTLLMERTSIFNVLTITNGAGMALVDVQDVELMETRLGLSGELSQRMRETDR